jgi:hypothetical protein
VALVALIIVSEIYNFSTGRGWLGYGSSPLAKCESQIKADAQYSSWDGSLPAYCTGKNNGNFTLNGQQLHRASSYAVGWIKTYPDGGLDSGNPPYVPG